MLKKQLSIKNSTLDFLVFTEVYSSMSLQVVYFKGNIWLTQKAISSLYNCSSDNVSLHLKNLFKEKELAASSVSEDFSVTASDKKKYITKHYSLEAIISVGYRVNTERAIEFRKWATNILKQFSIKGYALDKERLKNGGFLNMNFFDELLEEIREIRSSERIFYQKITDIFATSVDYEPQSESAKKFFATVQNKFHYSIHGNTAAKIIRNRANSDFENMGLTTWRKAPTGKILKGDVIVAKNYLSKEEITNLNRIVTMYLDFAEDQAIRKIPMTMVDWKKRLDEFLKFNARDILENSGKISMRLAKLFALEEYSKYRVKQDKAFESDFDKFVKENKLK